MLRTLLLAGLLATSSAVAQGVKLTYTAAPDSKTFTFNATSCGADVQVTWTSTITFGLCSELKLWATELECTEKQGLTDTPFTSVSQSELANRTNTFRVKLSELPGFKYNDGGVVCGTDRVERTHNICGTVSVNTAAGVCTVQTTSSLTAKYDTSPPVSPTIEEISEQDGALVVRFTASSDTALVHVEARPEGTPGFTRRGDVAPKTGSSIRISGLVNGVTYFVQLVAEDAASNFSSPSEVRTASPRLTKGFWARYRDAGGAEQGGCQAVHGLPFLLAGGLWLMRRKRNG